jgi:aspartate carbamoyltransferase catalytic subunit
MTSKIRQRTRHIVSINDLRKKEIDSIFDVADFYLKHQSDPNCSYRIGRSTTVASSYILASLFYEPSTRTRLSFESAMLRLGGDIITSADPATSSAAKGESLADSVRVIANYADLIVIRHPRDGAARLAAEYSPIPVINGGDGSHEHPTQTLCDVFTLKKKSRNLKNLKVAIAGDLKGSRTVHSFVYALARFGARIVPMPAQGMELPAHVDQRLRDEFKCEFDTEEGPIGAFYRTPEEPHQPALFSGPEFEIIKTYKSNSGRNAEKQHRISAVYVTRFQKERWPDKEQKYLTIDAEFLDEPKYSHANVLHPLPRVGEIDAAVDSDTRAVYFEQAAYGVPIRMALVSLLLGLRKGHSLETFEGGFERPAWPIYNQARSVGIECTNSNCIVHEEKERPYVRNKFYIVKNPDLRGCKLRCVYCETDIKQFVVAQRKNKWYVNDSAPLLKTTDLDIKDFILFSNESDARSNGFHIRRDQVLSEGGEREPITNSS